MLILTFLSFFILAQISFAGIVPRAELVQLDNGLEARQADSQCTNTPATRSCWGNGFSIATNYDSTWPNTGKVVKYNLEITNTTMNLDGGRSRPIYAINGQYPGPTIRASWGDKLQIKVTNRLTTNGTSIHWHGLRQWKTNQMDGTNGVTECPLAPGQTRTYTFLCTQFGTTWYHSHHSDQYSDGVVGTMVIDGPATSNYDYDLGAYPITDHYYRPAFELAPLIHYGVFPRGPPCAENILINGTNKSPNGTLGQYSRNTLSKGKKYRLRLINASTNDNFKVGLDGHDMTVITADFVPIRPYTTKWLFIGIGQRYDIVINANQAVDSYWFHVVPQAGCSCNQNPNAVSIFSYAGANSTTPSTATRNNAPPGGPDCNDPNAQLIPYVKLDVPKNATIPQSSRLDVGFAIVQNSLQQTLFQWNLNFTASVTSSSRQSLLIEFSINVSWAKPTLQFVFDKNTNYPPNFNLINLPQANAWSFWVIQAIPTIAPPIPHPIHLHGHDFYVLGAGSGIFVRLSPTFLVSRPSLTPPHSSPSSTTPLPPFVHSY